MLIFEEGKKYDINYSGISRHADSIAQTIFCHKLLLTDIFFLLHRSILQRLGTSASPGRVRAEIIIITVGAVRINNENSGNQSAQQPP